MAKETRSVIDQLEDAILRAGPAAGGVIGGLAGAGMLRDSAPPVIGFMVGGAAGAVVVYGILYLFFICINPKRDRCKKE